MNHFISLEQAVQMTRTFRENKDRIVGEEYKGQDLIATAETFDKAAIERLLAQEGCEKIRIYYGMDEALKVHAIIVGVDAEGKDQLPTETDKTSDSSTAIVELGQRCPPECVESLLNP